MTESDEKLLHLGADLEADCVERFRKRARELDLKSKKLLKRLIEWWLVQDANVQIRLYHDIAIDKEEVSDDLEHFQKELNKLGERLKALEAARPKTRAKSA